MKETDQFSLFLTQIHGFGFRMSSNWRPLSTNISYRKETNSVLVSKNSKPFAALSMQYQLYYVFFTFVNLSTYSVHMHNVQSELSLISPIVLGLTNDNLLLFAPPAGMENNRESFTFVSQTMPDYKMRKPKKEYKDSYWWLYFSA